MLHLIVPKSPFIFVVISPVLPMCLSISPPLFYFSLMFRLAFRVERESGFLFRAMFSTPTYLLLYKAQANPGRKIPQSPLE